MAELRTKVEQISRCPGIKPSELPSLLPTPFGPKLVEIKEEERKLSYRDKGLGLFSHRAATSHWGKTTGNENFLSFLPSMGMSNFNSSAPSHFELGESSNRNNMCLCWWIRAAHSFVSEGLAGRLQGHRAAISPIRVRVADGGILNCSQEIQNCEWWVQVSRPEIR
uniref:Uncharacterized protein n=1 Tax=Oryza punctata TaxID=4537 RepID=A0A0E0KN78_ORYPU